MALVYLLLGFTGLAGVGIARDELAKLESPSKTSEKCKASSCETPAEEAA